MARDINYSKGVLATVVYRQIWSHRFLGWRLLSEYSARYSIFVELLIFITNECARPSCVKKTIIFAQVQYTFRLHVAVDCTVDVDFTRFPYHVHHVPGSALPAMFSAKRIPRVQLNLADRIERIVAVRLGTCLQISNTWPFWKFQLCLQILY